MRVKGTETSLRGGYREILEFTLECASCRSCRDLLARVEEGVPARLGLPVRVWEEADRGADHSRSGEFLLTTDDGLQEEYRLEVKGPGRQCLHLEIFPDHAATFTHAEHELLQSLGGQIGALYPQLKEIDRLEAGRIRQELSRLNSPSNETVSTCLPVELLTKRERELVENLRAGLSNEDLAVQLGISRRTVEKHFQNIFNKLNLENRYQLLAELGHAPA